MRARRILAASVAAAALVSLTACSTNAAQPTDPTADADAPSTEGYPITIEHALGTTEIDAQPERIASVAWANQDVPLALGVMPVGMGAQSWGDEDGDGLLPWQVDAIAAIGGEGPTVYDETDGIDFEAVADTAPDVVLAAYSGLDAAQYETLTAIAPTVAYPAAAWVTTWREQIELNSAAMSMAAEGEALISDLEEQISTAAAEHPEVEGKNAAFFYFTPDDLSEVGFYTAGDPRTAFLTDLGLVEPPSLAELVPSESFYGTVSAENIDTISDVDIVVTYGDDSTLEALQADPLLSQLPAIANGAVVVVGNGDAYSAAVNPTALTIPWVLEDYLDKLGEAADKSS